MSTRRALPQTKLWLVPSSGSAPASPPSQPASTPPPSRPPLAFDDSELLAALRRGDPTAATALHDRLRPQIDRTIRRLLGPGDPDYNDLAQQAMIEVVSTIDRYRGDCSLDSWTSTVAAHIVYKQIRRRKTERRIFDVLDSSVLAEAHSRSRTGREAILRSLVRRVAVHIEAIEESKAWTFVLHDVCGYDLREIAEITGVSIAAAQSRLVRGRREIHEKIACDPELANLLESMEGPR